MSGYAHPEALASTAWLAERLGDPTVRVVDTRVELEATADGVVKTRSGRAAHARGHIPGAVFVDVMSDLADPADHTAILPPHQFDALMGKLGITQDSTVVVYDDRGGTWAARLWWALRYYGHDAVRLLDGGLGRWTAAGLAIECHAPAPRAVGPATFRSRIRPGLRASADDVARAIGHADFAIVDALPEIFFTGQARLYPTHRAGHVPTAHNVPAPANLDASTHTLLPAAELAQLWEPIGLAPPRRVITYCGGGVFGAFDLFVLHVMGHENAALYDASWMEWGADPHRPVETGPRTSDHALRLPGSV